VRSGTTSLKQQVTVLTSAPPTGTPAAPPSPRSSPTTAPPPGSTWPTTGLTGTPGTSRTGDDHACLPCPRQQHSPHLEQLRMPGRYQAVPAVERRVHHRGRQTSIRQGMHERGTQPRGQSAEFVFGRQQPATKADQVGYLPGQHRLNEIQPSSRFPTSWCSRCAMGRSPVCATTSTSRQPQPPWDAICKRGYPGLHTPPRGCEYPR
jgi:hypothetical protein